MVRKHFKHRFFINIVLSFCGLFFVSRNYQTRLLMYFSERTDADAISVANALKFETPSDLKLLVLWIKTIKMQQSECWICPY
jgi:hypothetical protein